MTLPLIGQTVLVERKGTSDRGHSRILDATADEFVLDEPTKSGLRQPLILHDNDEVLVSYRAPDGSMCFFYSLVLGKGRLDQLNSIRIKKPPREDVTRIQRRAFVRIQVPVAVSVICIREENGPQLIKGHGVTHDISGGGLAFYPDLDLPIRQDDRITLKFNLPGESPNVPAISAKGTVVRASEAGPNQKLLVSVRFEEITHTNQQKVMQYVFKKQIEAWEKGGRW